MTTHRMTYPFQILSRVLLEFEIENERVTQYNEQCVRAERLDLVNTRPHLIKDIVEVHASILGITLDEYDFLDEELRYTLRCIERDYYEHEYPNVLKAVQELRDSIPLEEVRELQRTALLAKLRTARSSGNQEDIKRITREIKVFKGELTELSQDQIHQARQYPLEKLIKHRNGMAICPFHEDKTASMDIRKNFYHCYGCGEHGNVIDFVMKTKNLSFTQAVHSLL